TSLMALKHIAGRLKVPGLVEGVREFLTENPNDKLGDGETPRRLVLFTQHIDVANELEKGINAVLDEDFPNVNHVLRIRGDSTPAEKKETATNCALYHWPTNDPFDRILICSTLSGGEGLNLQSAYDGWLCERQWNPANEREQPAGRFTRHGSKAKNVFFTTWTCLGTVEEQIAEINKRKDTYTPNLTGELSETPWDESSVMMEIAAAMRDRRRRLGK
ncbi:MAG TPA: C-terminal helicase domain-containing protein, partial [Anaerolineales bacterium]|nr:C-terminal helicase domain-containing protein [Anaerolineales bacterium]